MVETTRWRYWKTEPRERRWELIPDTPEARNLAIKNGAMFFTWAALSEKFNGNGQAEPHRWGDFPLDFDSAGDLDLAFEEFGTLCLAHLPELYHVDPYAIQIYLSGGKGFHGEIPAVLFGAQDGDPYLPLIYGRIANQWKEQFRLSSLDMSLYCMKRGHLFRIPNVRRSNGNYKVPIAIHEYQQAKSVEVLIALGNRPRQIDSVEAYLDPIPELVELYQSAKEEVYRERTRRHDLSSKRCGQLPKQVPPCIKHILTNLPKTTNSNFNKLIVDVVTFFQNAGYSKDEAATHIGEFISNYPHSTAYTTSEERAKHFDDIWTYLEKNEGYGFDCKYILGLKLPGSAFDCKTCGLALNRQGSGNNSHTKAPEKASETPPKEHQFTENEVVKAINDNEVGDAYMFRTLFKNRLCYDHTAKEWYLFNGHYWVLDYLEDCVSAMDLVVKIYARVAGELAKSSENLSANAKDSEVRKRVNKMEQKRRNILQRMFNLNTKRRRGNVLELAAAGSNSLGISGWEWDLNPWQLGCQNGVIDLHTGELINGRPENYIKTVVPTDYAGSKVPCPTWEKFLQEIFCDDQELVAFVQRMLGLSLIGTVIEHCIGILWGVGRNGKGTLLETIKAVLGDVAHKAEAELLLKQKFARQAGAPNSATAELRGRRIVWFSETEEGRAFDASKFKELTGGDSLRARAPYAKRSIEFTPSHSLFLITNNKPHTPSGDYAFWKRVILIPFKMKFVDDPNPTDPTERKADKRLMEKLKEEAPGILGWLVNGAQIYQKQGLNPPETVKMAVQEYQKEEDVLQQFIDENCTLEPTHSVRAGVLYKAYDEWSTDNGAWKMSQVRFGNELKKRFDSYPSNGIWYAGLKLTADAEN